MQRSLGSFAAFVVTSLAIGASPVLAANILPTVGGTLRKFPNEPDVLFVNGWDGTNLNDFFAIKATEDRTLLEFDLTSIPALVPTTTLDLDLKDLDEGGAAGTINVYSYSGNGVITADEFYAGGFFTSFTLNTDALVQIDVTSLVQAAKLNSQQYLGFRLSTPDFVDRYDTGPTVGGAYPVLNVVPEPSALAMALAGAAAIFVRRRDNE